VLVIPALDLLNGRVVRLHKGDFERQTAYTTDPVALAREYAAAGARRLHVVDLDAARGSGDNRALVERVVAESGLDVQVAGGVRDEHSARRWLESGAAAVVMGTTAVREPDLLAGIAGSHPHRVLAALDIRDGRPAVTGWLETETVTVAELLSRWAVATLGGIVLTSIDRDGTSLGPDLESLASARAETTHNLTYSGGIARLEDLSRVAGVGADAVILGRSLLEGHIALPDAVAMVASP
jgi:phosphoribosylformimino-5-aminoimidazole carboxamide ribotide isomerase